MIAETIKPIRFAALELCRLLAQKDYLRGPQLHAPCMDGCECVYDPETKTSVVVVETADGIAFQVPHVRDGRDYRYVETIAAPSEDYKSWSRQTAAPAIKRAVETIERAAETIWG